jgi:transcriptional regulator with XRE-family HTH domain
VARFGANLKVVRQKTGLTQAQLAEAAGLLQQYISLVESGRQNVTIATANDLANVLNCDIRDLLGPLKRLISKR